MGYGRVSDLKQETTWPFDCVNWYEERKVKWVCLKSAMGWVLDFLKHQVLGSGWWSYPTLLQALIQANIDKVARFHKYDSTMSQREHANLIM